MQKYDLSIVGSGMGGSMIAALNKNRNTILFEKDYNLGGCGSTFKKKGYSFNCGATTFVGYEENHPVKAIFDFANYKPELLKSKVAIRVIQDNKIVDRVKDFEKFLENINKIYPNKNNRKFWEKIREIDSSFWKIKNLYYAKYSFSSFYRTFISSLNVLKTFNLELLKSAKGFILDTLGKISIEYQNFIDSQLLITLQTKSDNINLLSLALGLAYPFHDVFYVKGGMGSLFSGLLKDVKVNKKEEIKKILKEKDTYRIISNKNEYLSDNIILNSSIYDCQKLFEDKDIIKYYNKFSFSDQSAFVINLVLDNKNEFLHHYQVILKQIIPNAISNSFFISFSDKSDEIMSKNNTFSITISTHTKATFWENLNEDEYLKEKLKTENFIIDNFLKEFNSIKKEDIISIYSATSKTFKRYINRNNCGGQAITLQNILSTPVCTTPFKGLYNIGDTIFAGQGWPGVALGVNVLNRELNE